MLITGFQPFADYKSNTSEQILPMIKMLSKSNEFEVLSIPTSYKNCFKSLRAKINDHKMIVCLGIHPDRHILMEKVALNYVSSTTADAEGDILSNQRIIKSAPSAYINKLPLHELHQTSGDYHYKISLSAGSYVCNYLYFLLLHDLESSGSSGVFIHVPQVSEDKHEGLAISVYNLVQKIRNLP